MILSKLDSQYDDVISAMDMLSESVNKYEGSLMDSIAELAKNRQSEQIRETLLQADRIKIFTESINELKLRWNEVIIGSDKFASIESKDNNDDGSNREVTARTTWKIADNSIRIETDRPDGTPYSNVFPSSTFKEIAKTAVSIADKNGSVKTTEVLNLLGGKIVAQSDYKKTPRIPVYATFKVLVKEGVLRIDETNSHKYLLGLSKAKAISWIEEK